MCTHYTEIRQKIELLFYAHLSAQSQLSFQSQCFTQTVQKKMHKRKHGSIIGTPQHKEWFPSLISIMGGVYDLKFSQPAGDDKKVLATLLRSVHIVYLFYTVNNYNLDFDFVKQIRPNTRSVNALHPR